MGNCNCKVNQQIDYLHKKYGHNIPISKKTHIAFTIGERIRHFFVYLLLVFISPILLFYIFYKLFFTKDKTININKLVGAKS